MTKEFLDFGKEPEWFELANTSVGFSGIPQSIAFSKDANHLFVGLRDGRLYRISNLSLAYDYNTANVNSPACIVATKELPIYLPGTTTPISQTITSIAVDPENANNVLVTVGNYGNDVFVYMTTNALDAEPTFTSKQGNLPKMPVYASIIEMSNPEMAMLGTEHGIFTTDNVLAANPVWVADQGSMGDVPVFDLKQQWINKTADTVQLINVDTLVVNYPGTNNHGIIYAATFGRGLFRCNNFRLPVGVEENPVIHASAQLPIYIFPNPAVDIATVSFEILENNTAVSYQIIDLTGRIIQSKNLGLFVSGKHNIQLDIESLPVGTYLIHMVGGTQSSSAKFLVY